MKIKVIKETKFKDISTSVRFRSELTQEDVSKKIILADLLSNVCQKYPDKHAVTNKLNELYGASFNANCTTYGRAQILEFSSKAIHPSFIDNKVDLLREQLTFLSDFIYRPLFDEDGYFIEKDVEEAKRITIARLTRYLDEPNQYCSFKALTIVGEGQPLGVNAAKDIELIKSITAKEITKFYHKMLEEDGLDILVLGDVDEKQVNALCNELFTSTSKKIQLSCPYLLEDKKLEPFYYGDKDITQAYITLMYTTSTQNIDADFWALRVANGILGQSPSSLLFREVREKHSLCYSISSYIYAYDGAMGISVGVDPENVDKTISLIKEQFKRVCDGDFDDELIDTTKVMLINMVENFQDDMNLIMNLAYRNMLLNTNETIEGMVNAIKEVSKDDILKAINKCTYISGYILRKGEADEHSK